MSHLCQDLVKRLIKSYAFPTDGLFMVAGPGFDRTHFIQEELVPALKDENVLVIRVDLSTKRAKRSRPAAFYQGIKKAFSELPIPLTFNPSLIGTPEGVALSFALAEVVQRVNSSVVLIIDYVEELTKSKAGFNLLASLKSARDAVNLRYDNKEGTYLIIFGFGTDEAQIKAMVQKTSQPFFGADLMYLPSTEVR